MSPFLGGGGSEYVTRSEFKCTIEAFSAKLRLDGFLGNISVYGADCYSWILAQLSIICSGNIAVALDKNLSAESIADHMMRTDSYAVFYTADYADNAIAAVSVLGSGYVAVPIDEYLNGTAAICGKLCRKSKAPDDVCAIFFTSGTTGKDRAVMLTQDNLISDIEGSFDAYPESMDERYLSVLPLHHCYGYIGVLLHIAKCATLCFCPNLRKLTKYFALFNPTRAFVVPQILEVLYQVYVSTGGNKSSVFGNSLKDFVVGGAKCPAEILDTYASIGIPLYEGYGITECSPVIALNRHDEIRPGSVGRAYPINSVEIRSGEIVVKGKNVFKGYYGDPIATKEAFTEDGWYRTGDLGIIDNSIIYITGRLKNLIITANGENVSPEELESKINNISFVSESIVYQKNNCICTEAIISDDFRLGKSESEIKAALDSEIAKINAVLPLYKHISLSRVRITPFTKTSTQKIKRSEVISGE